MTVSTVRPSGSQVSWRGSWAARAWLSGPNSTTSSCWGWVRSVTLNSPAWAPHLPLLALQLAQAEEAVLAERVEVRRVARDLERAHQHRLVGVGEVDGVERVDLAEGDDDREGVEPADRLDLLADAEVVEAPGLDQVVALLAEGDDRVEVAGAAVGPDRDAEHGVRHHCRRRPSTSGRGSRRPPARTRRTWCRCRRGRTRRGGWRRRSRRAAGDRGAAVAVVAESSPPVSQPGSRPRELGHRAARSMQSKQPPMIQPYDGLVAR